MQQSLRLQHYAGGYYNCLLDVKGRRKIVWERKSLRVTRQLWNKSERRNKGIWGNMIISRPINYTRCCEEGECRVGFGSMALIR
ncbi:hypothetical protein J6590_021653 [Homalodisca vitripennis]|nr:hypothetical protein J6590_021653 [Homalodisca vitripennis]